MVFVMIFLWWWCFRDADFVVVFLWGFLSGGGDGSGVFCGGVSFCVVVFLW